MNNVANKESNKKKIVIINGANLNLLGKREPHIYGSTTFEQYLEMLQQHFVDSAEITYFQSNIEGEIINFLHEIEFGVTKFEGVVLNAGAYSHTSIAIADALATMKTPVIEVHISNIYAREEFRHKSYLTAKCVGLICGLGLEGYKLAITHFVS
jgi:3-dehydroquinate dehydratase II